jgi:hypothetical protein
LGRGWVTGWEKLLELEILAVLNFMSDMIGVNVPPQITAESEWRLQKRFFPANLTIL